MSVRPKALVALAIVAAAAGMLLARAALSPPTQPPQNATVLPTPRPLPALSLLDQDSRRFDRARLEQRWSLLFFGFTRCPDICPTTLSMLGQVNARLASLPAEQRPQLVLVSVDPEHDSPAQLKSYLRGFDPGFVGVTGEDAAIGELTRSLSVAVTMQSRTAGDYSVDHTTAIFLIDPRGAWRAVFSSPHSPGVIADDYRRILALQ
jgi:protein SCO1/2